MKAAIVSLPGIALCAAVSIAAYALQIVEQHVAGHPYVEALVLAILLGTALRTAWTPSGRWRPGINVSAKLLLEIAVVLLGASVSLRQVAAAGPFLLIGIVAIVAAALATGYGVARLLDLPPRMGILIACGNAICGNSAIAAVAPVIGARADEVASSIAFTAILGVLVVLGLPLLIPLFNLSYYGYGVLAGLTVYAVPQVLAATMPVAAISTQVGTLVKLVRVLMLGPVVLALSIGVARRSSVIDSAGPSRLPPLHRLVPWFIIGFLVLAALRSAGLFPEALRAPVATTATLLTVLAMAALGLGVDIRVLRRVGGAATLVVTVSLILLIVLSLGLIYLLGLG